MPANETFYYLALKSVRGVGNVTARKLLQRFSNAREIFEAKVSELAEVGVNPQVISAIRSFDEEGEINRELEAARRIGCSIVCWDSQQYPASLKEIHDPPPYLYVRGELRSQDRKAIAVVGTRTPTRYGLEIARELTHGLVSNGVTVVGGLARGIDGAAHQAALDSSGRTLAVLGCGIDQVYPREHAALYRNICRQGAVISELKLGARPEARNFPVRNRIISGLSLGVVVVEAAQKSGSLITAKLANEQGREVFAVPGPLNSAKSLGTNDLIQKGAKLVNRIDDILEELQQYLTPGKPTPPRDDQSDYSRNERIVFSLLDVKPVHFDVIVRESNLSVPEVSGAMLTLIIKGAIYELPGKLYMKKTLL